MTSQAAAQVRTRRKDNERAEVSLIDGEQMRHPARQGGEGPPNFCRPRTRGAVLRVVEALRGKPSVNPDKVAVFGYRRGAIVAATVATQDARLAGVVLGAGA
jgi:hypothetical protein